jgi:heme/copper-type cytochrome/quinol oxidase subunit 1
MTGTWLTTADHKRLGRMYVVTALLFLVVGGVVGGLLHAQSDAGSATHYRLSDLHSTVTAVLVLAPLWVGIATYLVPLQIGAARLAFPRLQAFAFWTYALGGVLHLASYAGDGPRFLGLSVSRMMTLGAGDKGHTDLWVTSLAVVTIAAVLAAANLMATVLSLRTEGLTLARLPMFSWATLVSSAGSLVAGAVFLAGLLLLFLDQHFGGRAFFGFGTVGTQVVWQHTVWLYGRPDIYLLLVPGLGAASDMVSAAAGRPLADLRAARGAIAAVGFLSFGAWAAGTKVADAIVLPTYSILTAAIVLPIGALVLLWLDTLRRGGRPKAGVELAFVAGAVLALGGAGLAAAVAGAKSVDGSAWSTGQLHLAAFAPPLLLAVGALHYWAPKLWGRSLAAAAGGLQFLLLLGGSAVFALGEYIAGYDHADRFSTIDGSSTLVIAEIGGVIVGLGVLAVLASVVSATLAKASAGATDEKGLTLEWAAPSPPPAHNFDTIPEVRSAVPLADLRTAEAT